MDERTLVVTYDADDERRRTVEAALPAGVTATYLDDLDPAAHPEAIDGADAVLTFVPERELSDAAFEALRAGQVVQAVTAGVDHLPLEAFPDGVRVFSNAGAYAEPMGEHVVALYLALAKRLLIEHRNLQDGEWNQFAENREVDGSTCAIVGFGAVGEAAARRLQALGVEVLGINRSGESETDVSFLGTPDDLEHVLRRADGVVLAAPLTPETEGLIDAEALGWLAEDAMLINVGRGGLIDQADLYDHLESNPAFQAGLEVWWDEPGRDEAFEPDYPFLELPNVIGCPHNSSRVPGIGRRGQTAAVENVVRALGDGAAENEVDPSLGY
ncbi:MAG: 2-hydroxyacid dehydrogenase [Halobacteriales archaeon]|nr:2-hydroxyacid dehydrogenase [Halobacteriales archaeon]